MAQQYKAVIFDLGGVVVGSPFVAIAAYEKRHGLPRNYINACIQSGAAFQRFERGEITMEQFFKDWNTELNDVKAANASYVALCKRRGVPPGPLPQTLTLDARQLFSEMMKMGATIDERMAEAIRRIRADGRWHTIALTNAYPKTGEGAKWEAEHGSPEVSRKVKTMFDDFLDSSVEGLRKPDPAFYQLACTRNNVEPREAIFLDDIGENVRAAKRLGMTTIRERVEGLFMPLRLAVVSIGGVDKALKELESLLGIDLTSGHSARL